MFIWPESFKNSVPSWNSTKYFDFSFSLAQTITADTAGKFMEDYNLVGFDRRKGA